MMKYDGEAKVIYQKDNDNIWWIQILYDFEDDFFEIEVGRLDITTR